VARRAIAATLAGSTPIDVDVVSLVVTELIGRLSHGASNGGSTVDVHLDVSPARVRVHVTGPPRDEGGRREPEPDSTLSAGWSLLLMERTVDRWGIDDGPATRVWFEIDLAGDGAAVRSRPAGAP
jgi:hypothetical protein